MFGVTFVLITIVVSLLNSCVERQVSITEIYYDTAYKTEFVEVDVNREAIEQFPLSPSGVKYFATYFYAYNVSTSEYNKSWIEVSLVNGGLTAVYDSSYSSPFYAYCPSCGRDVLYPELSATDQTLKHLEYGNIVKMDTSRTRQFVVVSMKRQTPQVILYGTKTITEPMYVAREVPYLVEKQREIIQMKRIPFWVK